MSAADSNPKSSTKSQARMDGRIHVLFVSGTLSGGGAERVTSTLLTQFDRARFSVSLCLLRGRLGYPLPSDVPCTILGHAEGRKSRPDVPLAKVARTRPWIVWQTIRRLRRHIERIRPHAVVSNINHVNCVTASALRGVAYRPRWLARIGNNPAREDRWTNLWARWSYARADRIVANSCRLADAVADRYARGSQQVCTIGNPTDFRLIERLAARPGSRPAVDGYPVVVSVGRLSKQKRPDILLDAFTRVRRNTPAHLWVCGDGPLREAFCKEVAFRGLEPSVRVLGFSQNPYSVMRQAAVFVLTSDYEGLPNALIEGQGLGVPAVATRCDYGPDEIVQDGHTGYLAPPGDAGAVAGAITRLLQDPAQRAVMGNAAAARARKLYNAPALVRQWEDLVLHCCPRQVDRRIRSDAKAA